MRMQPLSTAKLRQQRRTARTGQSNTGIFAPAPSVPEPSTQPLSYTDVIFCHAKQQSLWRLARGRAQAEYSMHSGAPAMTRRNATLTAPTSQHTNLCLCTCIGTRAPALAARPQCWAAETPAFQCQGTRAGARRPGPATRMSGRLAPQQRRSSLAGPARPPAAGCCAGGGQLQRARPTAAPRPRLCKDAPGGAAGTPCPTACWGPRPCCPVRPCWRLLTATHPEHSWAACTLITVSLLRMLCSAEPLRASPSSRGDVRGSPRPSLPFTCDVWQNWGLAAINGSFLRHVLHAGVQSIATAPLSSMTAAGGQGAGCSCYR